MFSWVRKLYRELILYSMVFGHTGLWNLTLARVLGARAPLAQSRAPYKSWLRLGTCDVPLYKQIILDAEYDIDYPIEPKFIIDAGANIGLAAQWFARRFPGVRIISLEPLNENFELLEKNIENLTNVIPIKKAIWTSSKQIFLRDWGTSFVGYEATEESEPGMVNDKKIEAISVKDLIQQYSLEHPLLLKMDIEGGEKKILDDSKEWIQFVDCIAIELHERKAPGCTRAFYRATNDFTREWHYGENVFCFR